MSRIICLLLCLITTSAWAQVSNQQILSQIPLTHQRTAAEIAASVTPTNYGYLPGNVLRFGADPTFAADSTAAFNAALSVGGTVVVPLGTYKVSTITITVSGTRLIGETANQYGLAGSVIKGTSATADVIVVATGIASYRIANLFIDRTVTATAGAGIHVNDNTSGTIDTVIVQNQFDGFWLGGTNFSVIRNSHALSNYRDGFIFINGGGTYYPLQWIADNDISEMNNGFGFRGFANKADGASNITGPRFNLCGTFANANGGYIFTGGAFHWNDIEFVDTYSSTDGNTGFDFENVGTSITFVGGFAELEGTNPTGRGLATAASHVGGGILVQTSGVSTGFFQIIGFIARQNSFQGVAFASNAILARAALVGVQAIDNGAFGNTFGIDIQNTTAIFVITGGNSSNALTTNQTYGIRAAQASNIALLGMDLSNNATGAALASAGAFNSGTSSSLLVSATYTVATLPTCNATLKGSLASVTDATAPTYNAALTGGGAVSIPVYCNGSAWTAH